MLTYLSRNKRIGTYIIRQIVVSVEWVETFNIQSQYAVI